MQSRGGANPGCRFAHPGYDFDVSVEHGDIAIRRALVGQR
jgi:hypothetical protein